MKNITQFLGKQKQPPVSSGEWLSLDEYVTPSGESIMYARVRGESILGLDAGDLAVVARMRKPISTDLVLCNDGKRHSVRKFSEIKEIKNPLRLVARNGKPVGNTKPKDATPLEIVGVITHVVKTLVNQ